MKFRPCIDIHNGKVKQIVGGSLKDEGNMAKTNFASDLNAAHVPFFMLYALFRYCASASANAALIMIAHSTRFLSISQLTSYVSLIE